MLRRLFCVFAILLALSIGTFSFRGHVSSRLNIARRQLSSVEPVIPDAGSFKTKLSSDMKEAMKSKQKERLAAIRAIQTAIKQKEVDERVVVNDEAAVAIMAKLAKQRKESIKSYADSGRQDLVDTEEAELKYILEYMPQQLGMEEVEKMIDESIARLGATTIKDMGKVMAEIRAALAGKADLTEAGALIKKKLTSGK